MSKHETPLRRKTRDFVIPKCGVFLLPLNLSNLLRPSDTFDLPPSIALSSIYNLRWSLPMAVLAAEYATPWGSSDLPYADLPYADRLLYSKLYVDEGAY